MSELDKKPLTLFYCYADEDQKLCHELDRHLKGLKRNYDITVVQPLAGEGWKYDLDRYLETANVFLLMISPDFIFLDDYEYIMEKVLKKHKEGSVHVACVLLRTTSFKDEPFSALRFLNAEKPVTRWEDRDEIYASIQKRLKVVCEELQTSRAISQEEWLQIYETSALKEELDRLQLQSSVEIVDLKSSTPASEQERDAYYNGKPLKWRIIQAQSDVVRDQQQPLVDAYKRPAHEMRMLCLHGETGAGKSTLAWRVAFEITQNQQRPYLFLQVSDTAKSDIWAPLSDILIKYTTPIVILADDVFRRNIAKDAYELKDPLSKFEENLNVTIIATSRSNEIPRNIGLDLSFLKLEKVAAPTPEEKKRVMQKLNKKDTLSVAQRRRLRDANIWWVMMIELTEGTSLEHHVGDCIKRLLNQHIDEKRVIYRVYEYLCYAGVYQISIPASLLRNIDERFYKLEEHPLGKDLIVQNNASYTSLHPVFAKYALKYYDKRAMASIFAEIMTAMRVNDIAHRNFVCSLFFYNVKIDLPGAKPDDFLQLQAEVKDFLQQKAGAIDTILEQHCTHHELWHYWRGLYNEVCDAEKLSLIEKLMAQKEPNVSLDWVAYLKFINEKNALEYATIAIEAVRKHLKDLEKDQNAYVDFLTLVDKWGRDELWSVLIEETAQWLTRHEKDGNVRATYIDLVDKHGKKSDCQNAIVVIKQWLQHNERDVDVRALYIGLVEKHGKEEDWNSTIGDIAHWLKLHEENWTIRKLYLGLVEKHGKEEDWPQVLRETVSWLKIYGKDVHTRALYLGLVEKHGKEEDWPQVLRETAHWLKSHEEDGMIRKLYLGLVEKHGKEKDWQQAVEETAHWLKINEKDLPVRLAYWSLVDRRGGKKYSETIIGEMVQWLNVHEDDSHVFVAYIGVVARWGTREQRQVAFDETICRWTKTHSINNDVLNAFFQLIATKTHSDDLYVNVSYLLLARDKGSKQQFKMALEHTIQWLKTHENEKDVRAAYLANLNKRVVKEHIGKAIKETANWFRTHEDDGQVHVPYLKLVDNRGDEGDWARAIEESTRWLKKHEQNCTVRAPFLKLVDNRGNEKDWRGTIQETARWLRKYKDDIDVRAPFLKLVNNRGSEEDWREAIKETGWWLKEHDNDIAILAPYLKLVDNRGREEDWKRTIEETMYWFKEQKTENSQVYAPYLRLVASHGDRIQLTTTHYFMEDWLRNHAQEKGIYLITSGYGSVLSQLEMYTHAEEEFRRTLELRKSYVPARIGLAWTYYHQGKKKEAYDELKHSQHLVELGNEYPREKMLIHLERYLTLEGVQE